MDKKIIIAGVVLVVLGAAVYFGGRAPLAPDAPSVVSGEPVVHYTHDGYEPRLLRVAVGTEAVFVNDSEQFMWPASDPHPAHTILPGFDARRGIRPGDTYAHTFDTAGTWRYHDHITPRHTGEIIVE